MSDQCVFLETERLLLRPLEETDAPKLYRWINQPEMREYITIRTPISMLAERDWIVSIMKQSAPPHDIVFGIVLKESGELIGTTALHYIDWMNRRATTGSYIGDKENRGKGFGKESKQAVLRYAFTELDLEKIKSEVNATNEASQKCLESCGYTREGVRRSEMFLNGRRVDSILYGITQADWRFQQQNFNRPGC